MVWGQRVETDIEVWVPETHPLRARIAINGESGFICIPEDRSEEMDSRRAAEDIHRPGKVIADAVIDLYERS